MGNLNAPGETLYAIYSGFGWLRIAKLLALPCRVDETSRLPCGQVVGSHSISSNAEPGMPQA